MIYLDALARERLTLTSDYHRAQPFPHIVVDGAIDTASFGKVAQAFPDGSSMSPSRGNPEFVLELTDRALLHPYVSCLVDELTSDRFASLLAEITGLHGLKADPDDQWGIVRQASNGATGAPHAGPQKHPTKDWSRAISLVTYLHPTWAEANGGFLEFWSGNAEDRPVRIAPKPGRIIVWRVAETAVHGQSTLRCPPEDFRRTMTVWYYLPVPSGDLDTSVRGDTVKTLVSAGNSRT